MLLDYPGGNRKAQAGATFAPLGCEKWIGDLIYSFGRDAAAFIFDLDIYMQLVIAYAGLYNDSVLAKPD